MKSIPNQVSESVRRRNPHLYGLTFDHEPDPIPASVTKRIRQDSSPKMNKLELDWLYVLQTTLPKGTVIHSQQWRVRIGNGAWFKVDHCALVDGVWTAWECKGPSQMKNVARGMLALKCAASTYPEVKWILVWKDQDGAWQEQVVLP